MVIWTINSGNIVGGARLRHEIRRSHAYSYPKVLRCSDKEAMSVKRWCTTFRLEAGYKVKYVWIHAVVNVIDN